MSNKFMLNYPDFWNKKNCISYMLKPLSYLYLGVSKLRKIFTKKTKLPAVVICVGNITVGGTGKTPIIKELAKNFADQNLKIAIISKGYKSKLTTPTLLNQKSTPLEVGDEAIEIFYSTIEYKNIFVISSKSPIDSIEILKQIKPDIILVDDGMQNPSFYKDISLLVVDGTRGFGNGMIIPSGPLREKIDLGLNKADIIVSINPIDELRKTLSKTDKIFLELNAVIEIEEDIKKNNLLLVSGIGNPHKFFNFFKDLNTQQISFPDHHIYKQNDIDLINSTVRKFNLDYILTTEKDYAKLKDFKFFATLKPVKLKFLSRNIDDLMNIINEKIPKKHI